MSSTKANPPPFKPARPVKKSWTRDDLHTHLHTAVFLELTTIPLYLYALYSIKDTKSIAYQHILQVVADEMLHLALAGNTLVAVGCEPILYGPTHIPKYPSNLLFDKVPMNLRVGKKENIQTFVDVEAPFPPPAAKILDEGDDGGGDLLPNYHSIGEFYQAIEKQLRESPSSILPAETSKQFTLADGIWRKPTLIAIPDLNAALAAMTTIIVQGEGNPGHLQGSHYEIFKDLRDGDEQWDTFNVVEDPHTKDYEGQRFFAVSQTFDAAFCFLLLTIQTLWTISDPPTRQNLCKNNINNSMFRILPKLAAFLVNQPFSSINDDGDGDGDDRKNKNTNGKGGEGGKTAGPCFNYYDFKSKDPIGEMKKRIQEAVDEYEDEPVSQGILKEVQTAIGTYVELPGSR